MDEERRKTIKRLHNRKYYDSHVKYSVNLSKTRHKELIEWMEKQGSIAGAFKKLITEAVEAEKQAKNFRGDAIEFNLDDPDVKHSIESLGEYTTLEMLQTTEKTDSTPVCCLHCPYTDCEHNGKYSAEWLMSCLRYDRYKRTGILEKKELSVEERLVRLERLFILASPFIRIYNPKDEQEFKKIINGMGGDL